MGRAVLPFLCWLGLTVSSVAVGPGVMVEGKCASIARDGADTVWSIDGSSGNTIATLEAGRLVPRAITGLGGTSQPVSLETLPDGDVACLWRDQSEADDGWAVTRHRGAESRVWVRFHAALREPVLRGRREGSAVVTESGRAVVLLGPEGKPPRIMKLAEASFAVPKKRDDGGAASEFAPVRAIEDAAGGLWLWSPEWQRQSWRSRIAGVVHVEPSQHTETLIRIDDDEPAITQVVAWDEKRVAVAVAGKGLVLVPLATPKIERMEVPDVDAFRYIEQLFHDGSTWCAVTTPQPTRYEAGGAQSIQGRISIHMERFYDGSKPVCAFWKYADGRWSQRYDGLDKDPASQPRPWLRTAAGLFLGADSGPPWFFPAAPEEKPRRLAPGRLFPLPGIVQMTEAGAGQVLLLSRSDGRSCLWPADAPNSPDGPLRWEPLTTRGQALQDARGRIWCFREDGSFARWEAGRWIAVETPAALRSGMGGFAADDRDQGWLLPDADGAAAICDFSNGGWRVFPSLREALQAQLPRGVKLKVPDYPFYEPAFSADGRIGFFTGLDTVQLYEAEGWRKWKLGAIIGSDARLTGTPFFAADGRFSIPIGETTVRQWHGAAGWQLRNDVPVPIHGTRLREAELDVGDARITSGAVDRFGVTWWLRDRTVLSKTAWGRTVPVFSPGEPNPWQLGDRIVAALADADGHALLSNTEFSERHEHVFIHPRLPMPRTMARLMEVREDSARIALGGEGKVEFFTWQLDDGVWQIANDGSEILLQALTAGEHRFEGRAWNADLTPDAAGVTVRFHVDFTTGALIAKHLGQLKSSNRDEREAAARGLIGIGPEARDAIKAARVDASGELRWWLDAVEQGIQRRPAKAPDHE